MLHINRSKNSVIKELNSKLKQNTFIVKITLIFIRDKVESVTISPDSLRMRIVIPEVTPKDIAEYNLHKEMNENHSV